jgi:hypothetical protein
MESAFPMLNKHQVIALLKDEAIFSASLTVRQKCIRTIVKEADYPIQVIEDVVRSLSDGDNFRRYCLARIEEIKKDSEAPKRRRRKSIDEHRLLPT